MFLCTICSLELERNEWDRSMVPPCGHVFHEHCLYRWLDDDSTCPHCRRDLAHDSAIPLYFQRSPVENEATELKSLYDFSQTDIEMYTDRVAVSKINIFDLENANKTLRNQGQQLEKINSSLKSKLQQFWYLQRLISCSEINFKHVWNTVSKQPDPLSKIKFYCTLLKKQLLSVPMSENQLRSRVSPQEKGLAFYEEPNDANLLRRHLLHLEEENELLHENRPDRFSNILDMNDISKYLLGVLEQSEASEDVQADPQIERWLETRLNLIQKVTTVGKEN